MFYHTNIKRAFIIFEKILVLFVHYLPGYKIGFVTLQTAQWYSGF